VNIYLAKLLYGIYSLVGCRLADCLATFGIAAKHAAKHSGALLLSNLRLWLSRKSGPRVYAARGEAACALQQHDVASSPYALSDPMIAPPPQNSIPESCLDGCMQQ
jgi:hypothetical protein